jgi:hypothetical protein
MKYIFSMPGFWLPDDLMNPENRNLPFLFAHWKKKVLIYEA